MSNAQPPSLSITNARFSAIQAKLGLTDQTLGARLYRTQDGPEVVAAMRTGQRPVSTAAAFAMLGFEEEFDRQALAA